MSDDESGPRQRLLLLASPLLLVRRVLVLLSRLVLAHRVRVLEGLAPQESRDRLVQTLDAPKPPPTVPSREDVRGSDGTGRGGAPMSVSVTPSPRAAGGRPPSTSRRSGAVTARRTPTGA